MGGAFVPPQQRKRIAQGDIIMQMEIEQKIEEKNTDQKEEIVATEGYTLLCLMIGALKASVSSKMKRVLKMRKKNPNSGKNLEANCNNMNATITELENLRETASMDKGHGTPNLGEVALGIARSTPGCTITITEGRFGFKSEKPVVADK